MAIDLDEEKRKVELQKKRIQVKERLIKEKERQVKFKRISQIVEMAFKTDLAEFDDTTILGAFLEIAEKISDPEIAQKWKKSGGIYIQEVNEKPSQLLAISFTNEPKKEIRELLKKMKFRWNSFRREFCGHGEENMLKELLKDSTCSIEKIS